MKTVKLSYSIINTWAMGRWEEAVGQYLGKPLPATPAMELGRVKDEEWSDYALKHKQMHPELGGEKLVAPVTQQKYEKLIPLGDEFQILLRGRPDTTDLPIVYEYKCGRTEATQYVETFQFDYYKLLVPELEVGIYKCFNPYFKELTVGVKFLTDENAENALNHIISYGAEMVDYLRAEKLLIDYKMKEG